MDIGRQSISIICVSLTLTATSYLLSLCLFEPIEDKTRQDKTRQDKTRQDKTRQDKTRQDKTRQDKTRQDKKRQDKTRQDKTRQDKTRQDKTRQDKTRHPIQAHKMLIRKRERAVPKKRTGSETNGLVPFPSCGPFVRP